MKNAQQGFTLFEIVVVLVMIGLMSVMLKLTTEELTPPDRDLYTEKMIMFNRIAHARNEAMLRGQKVSFTVKEKVGQDGVAYSANMTPMRFEAANRTKTPVTAAVSPNATLTFDVDSEGGLVASPATITLKNGTETTTITVTETGYAK